jgi:hypothetical protein
MIRDLLVQQRKQILARWKEFALDAYPAESASFLKGESDRFRNPVGYTMVDGLEKIYDGLIGTGMDASAKQAIEEIIRMRAVQQFSPSEAVGFIIPLKAIVRKAVEAGGTTLPLGAGTDLFAAFVRFEETIDQMTLFAVDCYSRCREAVFQTSVKEARAGGMIGASIARRRTQ